MKLRMIAVALFFSALSAAIAQTHVPVATVAPRPEDVATIDGMIKAYYEVITGPAGQPRDWARDRSLYIKDLRFVMVEYDKAGKPDPQIVDHQAFVDGSSDGLSKGGFYEKEIHRVTERFGPIAHVWSTYETRRTETGPILKRGINSIELFWDGKRAGSPTRSGPTRRRRPRSRRSTCLSRRSVRLGDDDGEGARASAREQATYDEPPLTVSPSAEPRGNRIRPLPPPASTHKVAAPRQS